IVELSRLPKPGAPSLPPLLPVFPRPEQGRPRAARPCRSPDGGRFPGRLVKAPAFEEQTVAEPAQDGPVRCLTFPPWQAPGCRQLSRPETIMDALKQAFDREWQ